MLNQEDVKRTEYYPNCTLKNILWVFRQSGNGVIADIIMKFKFTRRNNEASMKSRIESILQQMTNNSEDVTMNPTQLICKYHFFYIPFRFSVSLYKFYFLFLFNEGLFFPELNFVKTAYYEVKCNI